MMLRKIIFAIGLVFLAFFLIVYLFWDCITWFANSKENKELIQFLRDVGPIVAAGIALANLCTLISFYVSDRDFKKIERKNAIKGELFKKLVIETNCGDVESYFQDIEKSVEGFCSFNKSYGGISYSQEQNDFAYSMTMKRTLVDKKLLYVKIFSERLYDEVLYSLDEFQDELINKIANFQGKQYSREVGEMREIISVWKIEVMRSMVNFVICDCEEKKRDFLLVGYDSCFGLLKRGWDNFTYR